jgi:hypothetical protein
MLSDESRGAGQSSTRAREARGEEAAIRGKELQKQACFVGYGSYQLAWGGDPWLRPRLAYGIVEHVPARPFRFPCVLFQ